MPQWSILVALCLVEMLASSADAQQVVVFDEHWTHMSSTPDSHYNVDVNADTPSNFESPIRFRTLHFHMEILSKPTDEATHMVFCWNTQPTYSCAGRSPRFESVGLVEWATPLEDFWHPREAIDFSQGIRGLSAIVKDTENRKPTADNVGEERAARFFPLEVRLVATLVAEGATYVPPGSGLDDGVPDADGMDAGRMDGGMSAMDAGAADASLHDAGSEPVDVGVQSDAGPSADVSPFDADLDGGAGSAPGLGGCAVARVFSSTRGPQFIVLVFGLLAWRRAQFL